MNNDRVTAALESIELEYHKACSKHKSFNSPHEAFGVIFEEVYELFDEIRQRKPNRKAMAEEAVQLAAMCVRFLTDLCGEEKESGDHRNSAMSSVR